MPVFLFDNMDEKNIIKEILTRQGIDQCGFIPLASCLPANQRLWDECAEKFKTAAVFLLPYRTSYAIKDDYIFSAYARTYDYHKRCAALFDAVIPELKEALGYDFAGYADHSPIREKEAAARCGLGSVGRNTLLINRKYGSYVFIASILTDMEIICSTSETVGCINCGRCAAACPGGAIQDGTFDYTECLSYISQKKEKTPEELEKLQKNRIIWGCDICQDVCPMNKDAVPSCDPYFSAGVLDNVNARLICSMDDTEFARYPFSWRKRSVITENFKNCGDIVD